MVSALQLYGVGCPPECNNPFGLREEDLSLFDGLGALPKDNNNPFALIQNKPSPWQGLVPGDSGFLTFTSPVYGVRAGFINLVNTYLRKGLDTIEKIFPVYAPAGHGANDPPSYIAHVERISGINRKQKITSSEDIYAIGRAIVQVEEGNFWVTQADFDEGFRLAMANRNIDIAVKTGGSVLLIAGVAFGIWYYYKKKKKIEST